MDENKTEHILLISLFTLIIFPLLYVAKLADDNTFTSWKWVFSETNILHIFLFLVIGTSVAFAFSRLSLSGPYSPLFLFIFSFAGILPLWNEPESIIDASRYFLQAKSLKEYGTAYFFNEWGRDINAWTDMPLIPFIYGLIFKFLGEVRAYIQAFTTLLFASTVVLTYFIGKILWNEETGFNAGLLLMGGPYLLMQVPLMLVDVPAMFLVSLSIYTFLNALKNGSHLWIISSSLAISLTIFSKYSALFMLSVLPVILIVSLKKDRKEIIFRTLKITIVTCLLSGLAVYAKHDIFLHQIEILRTYQLSGLGRWQESFISTFLFQTHPFLTTFAIYAAYKAIRDRDTKFLIAGWFVIFVVLLQIKRIRYILPLFPLFTLMASYGLNEIKTKDIRRFISFCIVTSSLVIAFAGYLPFLSNTSMENIKKAGEYLDSLNCETVSVYALPQKESDGNTLAVIPILDYFTDKRILSDQDWSLHYNGKGVSKSSLRFTWEMKKPSFYSGHKQIGDCPSLVISSQKTDCQNYFAKNGRQITSNTIKTFYLSKDFFRFQTLITICP